MLAAHMLTLYKRIHPQPECRISVRAIQSFPMKV